ncbi:actinin-like protein [Phaffia rhodozyma]|uniref:Actinin-like protein n=1 Tax=Phaffia rhodozyma TaxID=264483 RepID=A0A0F7SPI5_PHARH|nr:actinin-like protein [Phaffia rhodozyma]
MDSPRTSLEAIQERTFCKWLNSKLATRGIEPMEKLGRDLSDGVRLIQLMEIMGDTSLGRYVVRPAHRIQCAENVTKALNYIRARGIQLTNIAAEDIIDPNLKLILGLIWTLILRFTIADISEEGLSAKDGLLLWVQRKTAGYAPEVDVQDFTWSWTDGLALCALIHHHRPDLLDYHRLNKNDREANTELAFKVAEESLGIPRLLEVADLCDARPPDERSIMTYVAGFFHAFSNMNKAETVVRRVEKFITTMEGVWSSKNDYERRARLLLQHLSTQRSVWSSTATSLQSNTSTYPAVRGLSTELTDWKKTAKREWVRERGELRDLLGNVRTKLKTYRMRAWEPEEGLGLQFVDESWNQLLGAEVIYSKSINSRIRQIKDTLMREAARIAQDLQARLHDLERELGALSGELENQKSQASSIQATRLASLQDLLEDLRIAEANCMAANVEDNDYTVLTWEDLSWELELFRGSLSRRIGFIENQIVSRGTTNLTPAQLEEFESTFRHFDSDETNTLTIQEFTAALASLSISYSDQEIDRIHATLVEEFGAVDYRAFTSLLVEITQDTESPEQLSEAFREIAREKPYITELDLELALLPASSIDFLKTVIPSQELDTHGHEGVDDREKIAYDYDVSSLCYLPAS